MREKEIVHVCRVIIVLHDTFRVIISSLSILADVYVYCVYVMCANVYIVCNHMRRVCTCLQSEYAITHIKCINA